MDKKNQLLSEIFSNLMEQKGIIFILEQYNEFQRALSNPNVNADMLASIIKKGPGMTTSILKMANSSYYGRSKNIHSVKQAISTLGFSTISRIFLTQTLQKIFTKENKENMNLLWKHSLGTAIAASEIISIKHPELSDLAFTAGLLHDIGKFILLGYKFDEMAKIYKDISVDPYQYSFDIEKKVFDVDHQEIGGFFLSKWYFPEEIVNAVEFHHELSIETCTTIRHDAVINIDNEVIYASSNESSNDERRFSRLPITVAIGNNISKALELGQSTSGLIELLPNWIWERVGLNETNLIKVVRATKTNYINLTS